MSLDTNNDTANGRQGEAHSQHDLLKALTVYVQINNCRRPDFFHTGGPVGAPGAIVAPPQRPGH